MSMTFLIGGNTFEKHLLLLKQVHTVVSKAGFTLPPKKCEIALSETKFLGYIISRDGLKPDPAKVSAIKSFVVPETPKEVKIFIGGLSYYRSFIQNFSELCEPLIKSTRTDVKFTWGNEQEISFRTLKKAMITAPVLKAYDPFLDTQLKTDASGVGVGVILEQLHSDGWHAVA